MIIRRVPGEQHIAAFADAHFDRSRGVEVPNAGRRGRIRCALERQIPDRDVVSSRVSPRRARTPDRQEHMVVDGTQQPVPEVIRSKVTVGRAPVHEVCRAVPILLPGSLCVIASAIEGGEYEPA